MPRWGEVVRCGWFAPAHDEETDAMGTKQNNPGSAQGDNRPQGHQGGDPQRNKQSDQPRGAAQDSSSQEHSGQNVHGEGNYAASKQYNDATRQFAQSGRVDQAARAAAPKSDADAKQMQAAEAEGKRHAKGEDPALNRKRSDLAPDASRAPKPGEQE
jgi:hypothetical protein